MKLELMLSPRGKFPLLEAQRRVKPAILHHATHIKEAYKPASNNNNNNNNNYGKNNLTSTKIRNYQRTQVEKTLEGTVTLLL